MDVFDDKLRISQSDRDEKGKQIDPEERPVERVITTAIPVGLSNGQSVEAFTKGDARGEVPNEVSVTGSAVEFAQGFRGRCRLCKHFDREGFRRWKKDVDLSGDPERRKFLNFLRSKVLGEMYEQTISKHQGPDGDLDVEHAVNEFGICRALSHAFNDLFAVWPDAGCPVADPSGKPIDPAPFTPRDSDAAREGTSSYDTILKTAAGSGPKRSAKRIDVFGSRNRK